jgi:hypothetical protein
MKKELTFLAVLIMLVSLLTGLSGCSGGIKSPSNSEFTIRVSGQPGTEFTGFCTHEVRYFIGSRTEETDIQGTMTVDKTAIEFRVMGTEISCKIESKRAGEPITAVLFKDSVEIARMEKVEYAGYFDWYPPAAVDTENPSAAK